MWEDCKRIPNNCAISMIKLEIYQYKQYNHDIVNFKAVCGVCTLVKMLACIPDLKLIFVKNAYNKSLTLQKGEDIKEDNLSQLHFEFMAASTVRAYRVASTSSTFFDKLNELTILALGYTGSELSLIAGSKASTVVIFPTTAELIDEPYRSDVVLKTAECVDHQGPCPFRCLEFLEVYLSGSRTP